MLLDDASNRRRHWPMAQSTKRCGTLPHSATMAFFSWLIVWIVNAVEEHPKQHNRPDLNPVCLGGHMPGFIDVDHVTGQWRRRLECVIWYFTRYCSDTLEVWWSIMTVSLQIVFWPWTPRTLSSLENIACHGSSLCVVLLSQLSLNLVSVHCTERSNRHRLGIYILAFRLFRRCRHLRQLLFLCLLRAFLCLSRSLHNCMHTLLASETTLGPCFASDGDRVLLPTVGVRDRC